MKKSPKVYSDKYYNQLTYTGETILQTKQRLKDKRLRRVAKG